MLLKASFCCLLFFVSCQMQGRSGIKKDFNTGITTTYSKMMPQETLLVMNGETLHHTDIPLGENFVLVNTGVTGMVEKNGKVSAGCSLEITDSVGKVLLQEPDLFLGRDVFDVKDASVLKCTIQTGAPMEWDKSYHIKVVFRDKYGTGKIENEVKINMIDIP